MSDLTPFDVLMRDNEVRLPPEWQVAFEEAEQTLALVHPEGYDLLEVGRLAFESLHDDLKPAALDALVYGWWETYQDRKARNAWAGGAA